MASIADLFVNVGADISDFKKQMSDLQSNLKGIGDGMKKTGKKLTTGLTLPLAGLATASVMTFANFEKSMNKVAAISGATGKELDDLTGLAKELGATTKFSASEAADGMSFLAMAGFEVSDIMKAMPGMLDLAAASGMDLASTADIASNILTGFALEAGEAGRVADLLAAASSSANTDVSQLGTAMAYVAPVAAGAGISIEETSAAIGMLSDAGIQGSRAGTTLRNVISRLQNPVGEAKKVMEELGLSMDDLDPTTQSLADIMKTLEASGMDSAQAMRFFGQEAGPGITAMLAQGSDKLETFAAELANSEGAAADMAGIMSQGLAGAFVELQSALEGAAIEFGEVLAPVVAKVAQALIELVRWFGGLSPEIKTTIAIVGALVAAIGPLLVILGIVVNAVAALIPVFTAIASTAILPVIAAIGALIAIGVLLYQNWETVKEYAINAWGAIVSYLQPVIETITAFIMEKFEQVKAWWMELWPTLQEAFVNIWNFISEVATTVTQTIVSIFEWAWPYIETLIKGVWENIKGIINGALDIIMGVISAFANLFTGNWSGLWESIKQILSGVLELLWNLIQVWAIGRVLKLFGTFMKNALNLFKTGWNGIKSVFNTVLDFIRSIVSGVFSTIRSIINGAMNGIRSIISTVLGAIRSVFTSIFNAVRNVVSSVFNKIRSIISSVLNAAKSVVTSVLNAIRNTFTNVFNAVKNVVTRAINAVKDTIGKGIRGALDIVKNLGSSFKDAGKGLIDMMAKGISGAVGKVVDSVKGVAKKVRDFLPFSPAKEGPLSDLDKLDFGGPISDSIEGALPRVQSMMQDLVAMPDINGKGSTYFQTSSTPVIVYLDGREVSRGTLPHMVNEIRLRTGVQF